MPGLEVMATVETVGAALWAPVLPGFTRHINSAAATAMRR